MAANRYIEINIQFNDCAHIEMMAKSAARIAHHNFRWQYVTLVLLNTTVFCGVNVFLENYNKTAVIATEKLKPNFYDITKQFVLFGNDLENILNLIAWMDLHKFDNTGRFLVIYQSLVEEHCDKSKAVEMFWNHKIVNIIFINNVSNYGAKGYTYNYGKNCKNSHPTEVKDWYNCNRVDQKYCKNKYPLKLRNLHGCPIIVSTFMQKPYMNFTSGTPRGADGDLLNIIIEALNASLTIRTPLRGDGWGNLDENETWVGSLGDLFYDLANFSMTSASITQTRHRDFQTSISYYSINIGWVTHPPEKERPSYKLLRPFKVDTRIALIISFGIVLCIVLILKTKFCLFIFKKINSGRDPENVLFLSWEMCMGQPTVTFPSKMALSYLVLIWIWYCFLMRTFYQVHLINSLKNDIYLDDFSSINDAIEANYPFGGGGALKDHYIDQPIVYNKWKHKESTEYLSIMVNLTHGMKFVLAMNLATAKDFLKEPSRNLHILPQVILSCPSTIFFKKYSPLANPINQILERLIEFGWPNMFFKKSTMRNKIQTVESEDKPITLSNFTGCYLILICGWLSSLILFFIEIYFMKKKTQPIIAYRN